jgi:apolipoprotein N-acyltransferase
MEAKAVDPGIGLRTACLLAAGAVVSFELAYESRWLTFLIAVYLCCVFELTRVRSSRQAYYFGLAIGVIIAATQMHCFWTLFGAGSIALWYVLGFWIGLFVVLVRLCRARFGAVAAALLAPFLWTGLEYFRSELYYLKFSWLNAGYVFAHATNPIPIHWVGVYGIGFILMAAFGLIGLLSPTPKKIAAGVTILAFLAVPKLSPLPAKSRPPTSAGVAVAGVQLEFADEVEVRAYLEQLIEKQPEAQLLVLCEYTFNGPVPDKVKAWCKQHERYLIVGGKDPAPNGNFNDTAFVVGPTGEIVFKQGKSVPVQFLKDGLPAKEQKLWESPWGPIGICICYDLSYSRVTDPLIRMGARAIIVPTMDVEDWGRRQHELHARVAPIRAAEYGVPIFRVASSGISQLVDADGREQATAPMPGQGAIIAGRLELGERGRVPMDRGVAILSVVVAGGLSFWFVVELLRNKWRKRRMNAAS